MTNELLDKMNKVTEQTVAEIGVAADAAVSRTSKELSPCPFCGGQPSSQWHGGTDETGERYGYHAIECCDSVYIHAEDTDTAIAMWNKRHAPEPRARLDADISQQEAWKRLHPPACYIHQGKPCDCHVGHAERRAAQPPAVGEQRYQIVAFRDALDDSSAYRITDTRTDSRVATCYVQDNAEMVRDALNRAPTSEPEWQPIETAPKDGSDLLLAKIVGHIDHPTAVWWMVKGSWSLKWNKWWDGIEPCGLSGPSHWMPIPRRLALTKEV